MKILFVSTFVVNVLVALTSAVVLPERVAVHFGIDGTADGWGGNWSNALLMIGLHLLLFCSFYFSPRLVFRFPPKWVNLPNKDYWLAPENRERTSRKLEGAMWRFGFAMFLFLLLVELLSLDANLSNPVKLDLRIFLPAFAAFMIYTVWWTVALLLAFRLPKAPTRRE